MTNYKYIQVSPGVFLTQEEHRANMDYDASQDVY